MQLIMGHIGYHLSVYCVVRQVVREGSSCICTAGQGEACTHAAAMQYAMKYFTSLGHHKLPDDPAGTEILCAWNAPKTAKVDTYFNNLNIVNMCFSLRV